MSTCFAGLTPSDYDRWRTSAEFFGIEKRLILPIVRQIAFTTVLDVGCGTGVWSREIAKLRPSASVVGIDSCDEMICYAAMHTHGKDFRTVNRFTALNGEKFDLVICAMSADYIGFASLKWMIASSLSTSGVALFWILDPTRYELRDGYYVKTWVFEGRELTERVPGYDPYALDKMYSEGGFDVSRMAHRFCLTDGIVRSLLVFKLSWPRPTYIEPAL